MPSTGWIASQPEPSPARAGLTPDRVPALRLPAREDRAGGAGGIRPRALEGALEASAAPPPAGAQDDPVRRPFAEDRPRDANLLPVEVRVEERLGGGDEPDPRALARRGEPDQEIAQEGALVVPQIGLAVRDAHPVPAQIPRVADRVRH